MPRQARLDSPGLLHHVMARGLNRRAIFSDDRDRRDFLRRIQPACERTPVEILAWALMPNHLHFLIRSGVQGIGPFMRRLLTGYALAFNRRHHRVGYLFQGRYKSLVCDEEDYLLTLVRYIHLNPVCGKVLKSLKALADYPYTGHAALMGRAEWAWQNTDEVLGRFGRQAGLARRRYERYLEDGFSELRNEPTDELGGGLLPGLIKAGRRSRREGDRALQDPRVLGESNFVQRVWRETEHKDAQREQMLRKKTDMRSLARKIAKHFNVNERSLFERGRPDAVARAKAALIYASVEGLGKRLTEMARLMKMTVSGAGKALRRGSEIAVEIEKIVSRVLDCAETPVKLALSLAGVLLSASEYSVGSLVG